ncbi:type I phosphomannose isomerase catalytic subunit [Mycoplasmoides gallisepticum]|uniref:type I phosphomannose isomerase catalytic subunit n=1 Tax=Mycoplasmoides gallisepticum TaxID=2096 RepID=UPI00048456F9|nr:type I phosphomannose isomerase catalytic subunit [Mycoplasmoides gallisepticum]
MVTVPLIKNTKKKMHKPKILKLLPHFEYRVWSGDKIKTLFNLDQEKIGEAWIISALENKSAKISENQTLLQFYQDKDNAYFFNSYNLKNEYPLLVKIIDAKADLSVQIHPDDAYAKQFNSLGKTECWYILDTKKNNQIVFGHQAKTLDQFKSMVDHKQWNDLLLTKPIKKDHFIYVPSKKLHAIKADTLIYELQQSSDITYRVYDYDRLDQGKKRELHLEHVFNLVDCPDLDLSKEEISNTSDYLVANKLFNLIKIENKDQNTYKFDDAQWVQLTVIKNHGTINNLQANLYDSFIIAHNEPIVIKGNLTCLISYVK